MEAKQVANIARIFKDNLLIPLANAGVLDADMTRQAALEYIDEIHQRGSGNKTITVQQEGELRLLHPYTVNKFILQGKEWLSIEHYYQAAAYMGVDDEFVESIRTCATPQLAHRKALNALQSFKMQRPDWDTARMIELDRAYRQMLRTYEEIYTTLRATGSAKIVYPTQTDKYLGVNEDGTGKNVLGEVLMAIRNSTHL